MTEINLNILDDEKPQLCESSDRTAYLPPLELEKAQQMADFFGLLGDANRLRIISLLADTELCVGDLAIALGMSNSAVSHQLKTLRALRLVKHHKQGRHVFYQLLDRHVFDLYNTVLAHLDETTID
jgi:ArsR family transcriptional regulator, lead/cadmium/zinc/bismuth-responsive transcriptional repressor